MKESKRLRSILGMMCIISVTVCLTVSCKSDQQNIDRDIEKESVTYESLPESKAGKFSYDDLIVNKLKMGMSESEVKQLLGEPANYYNSKEVLSTTTQLPTNESRTQLEDKTEKQTQKQTEKQTQKQTQTNPEEVLDERVYAYNDLTLIFMPVDGSYKLCAAASVGDDDIFSRGIKVGDSKDKILEMFYRDSNCLNNNLMTQDNETIIGKYLYGHFTVDNLSEIKTSAKIEYGIINYTGYSSFENAPSYIIEFTYFEPPYKGQSASFNDAFAQIAFDIDGKGIITGIRWYYYPEIAIVD